MFLLENVLREMLGRVLSYLGATVTVVYREQRQLMKTEKERKRKERMRTKITMETERQIRTGRRQIDKHKD